MKQKIRVASDIHNEFHRNGGCLFKLPVLPDDKDTILILPGDIDIKKKHFSPVSNFVDGEIAKQFGYEPDESLMEHFSRRFKHVVYVLGNHDAWTASYDTIFGEHKDLIEQMGLDNVHLLDADTIEIDGIVFTGGTLWTNFKDKDVSVMSAALYYMNDYRYMRTNNYGRRVVPEDIYQDHVWTLFEIENALRDNKDKPVVVVTHHAPSIQSIHDRYLKEEVLNHFYYSDLEHVMMANDNLKLWFHGHVHNSNDYVVNNCRVISNPYGYHEHEENIDFDPTLVIELDTAA